MDDTGGGFVVGWGTLALINAALAQTKNRSRLGWFLLSLFFGPVATLAILLIGTGGRRRERFMNGPAGASGVSRTTRSWTDNQ